MTGGIGDRAKSIFNRDNSPKKKSKEITQADSPKKAGRPKVHTDDVLKTVITIRKEQLIWLDRLALDIRANSGQIIDRGLLIRAFIDAVIDSGIDLSKIQNEDEAREIIAKKIKGK